MRRLKKYLIAVAMLLSLLCVLAFIAGCSNSGIDLPADSPTETKYTVTFVADGNTIATCKYTAKNKNITEPEVPAKDGYVGIWESYTLDARDITVNAVYKVCSEGLNFELNSDGNSYYVAGKGSCTDRDIVIPPTYKGKPVTRIGERAFNSCFGLTSITIGSGVTSIGDSAFSGCTSLKSVTIGSGVTSIGDSAFSWCTSLKSVTIGSGVTSIGDSAFYFCTSLTSITIPNSVTSIGDFAFYFCRTLTSITIPNSVTSIDAAAFSGCIGLTSITIPNSVTSIGGRAFSICGSLTSVTIPNSVTSIGDEAFSGCNSLTSITIPSSVKSIGDEAFSGCDKLVEVINNSSLDITKTSYGLSALNVKKGGSSDIVNNDGYLFYTCNGVNYLLEYDGNATQLVLPQSYNGQNYEIYKYAFRGCSSLTIITIPNSVTSIGGDAFRGCSGLESITVASGNTKYHSAGNCLIETATKTLISGCKNSVIPTDGSVTSIGNWAFLGCDSLTSITIPNSVTSIGERAFSSCDSLTTVTFAEGSKLTSIGDCAFYDCKSLTSITIPDSVTSISSYAFNNCKSLTSITMPNSVTSIGEWAFSWCDSLTSITIPESVTSIGERAFYSCDSLTSITFNGTKAQWKAISKGEDWKSDTGDFTVTCTNGTLTKSEA